jgi:hypothetical protein
MVMVTTESRSGLWTRCHGDKKVTAGDTTVFSVDGEQVDLPVNEGAGGEVLLKLLGGGHFER